MRERIICFISEFPIPAIRLPPRPAWARAGTGSAWPVRTLGFLSSKDGLVWEQHPPVVAPGLFARYEVPEYIGFNGRHYVLFCTNSTAAPRFDPYAQGPHSGTYYVVSDSIRGPYVRPPGD